MEKIKKIPNKIAIGGYLILIFAVIIIFTCAIAPVTNREPKGKDTYVDYSDGWLADDGSAASLSHMSGTTVIHRKITQQECDKTLFFFAKTANVRVLIDDECIYENPKFSTQLFGKTPGALFVKVPVAADSEGKTLSIEVTNPYDDSSAKLSEMYIGTISDIMQYQMQKRFVSFCLSFITMALGFGMLLLFIPLAHQRIVGRELLYLGLAAFVSGLFLTSDGRFIQLLYGNAHVVHVIAETTMQLIIPPFLLFLGRMYKNYNITIAKIFCIISEITFFACFISEISGYRDYHQNLILTHIMFAISLVFVFISTIKGFIKEPKANVYHNLGCVGLCVLTLTDIVILWAGIGKETSYFVRLGVLFFIGMEAVQIVHKFLKAYQSNIKNELLSRLAYHDGLTELLNRTSYMEEIKNLEDGNLPYVLFAIYDVNNLKKVNDTMGHQKGDEMIKRVADVLNASLGKYGKCFRIGGDEFAFISTSVGIEEDFVKLNDQLVGSFGSISDGDGLVPITVAMGYSVLHKDARRSLDDAIREADSQMYENKRTMKHRVG